MTTALTKALPPKPPADTKILLVDDEPDFRAALELSFKRKGYQTLVAANGREAFDLIQSQHVDVVISDIQMPGGDGVELLDRTRKSSLHTPIVLLVTGYSELSTEEAYNKGAEALFSKPLDRKVLEETVSRLLVPPEARWSDSSDRVDTELNIALNVQGLSQALDAQVISIGRGGMFVCLPQNTCPNVNDSVEFKIGFSNDGPSLNGSGIVRWVRISSKDSKSSAGCGIEFTYLGHAERELILEYIKTKKPMAFIPNQ